MRISESITYDAPPAAVLEMLTDPDFQQRVADRSRPLRSTVERAGDRAVRVERTHSGEGLGLPSALRVDEVTLVQEQRWEPVGADGTARGTVTVEVRGMPVRFDGTLTLSPDGEGTRESLEGDLAAKVPLVGGKIEKSAAPAVLAAVRSEAKVGREWLATR